MSKKKEKTCCEEEQQWFTHPCNKIDTGTRDYGLATATCGTCGKKLWKKSFANPNIPPKLYIAEKDTSDYRCTTCGGSLIDAKVRHDILIDVDITLRKEYSYCDESVVYCPKCERLPKNIGSAFIRTTYRRPAGFFR